MGFWSLFKRFDSSNDSIKGPISTIEQNTILGADNRDVIYFSQIRVPVQVVLVSEPIESKSVADNIASAISLKYSATTTVNPGLNNSGYSIWLYRIPLDIIQNYYDPAKNSYGFKLSELNDGIVVVDADEIIKTTPVGHVLNVAFEVELERTPNRFHLLFEDDYYRFYTYYSGYFIRVEKNTNQAIFLGRYVHIEQCATLFGKLFFYESRGITGDREIYASELNGRNAIPLHCLSNEKIPVAGHAQSEDKVISLQAVDDYIVVNVCRRTLSGIFNYLINITCINGEICVSKRNI